MSRSKIRVAPYLRVSADPTGREKSVTDQAAEYVEDLADHPQWSEVRRYTDNDRSASRFARKARPDFDRLLADVEAGQVDLVWLWEVSRFSRDLAVFVPLRELCRRLRLKWYVHAEERLYDFARPADVRALTRSAVDAEEESEKTSMRIQRSVRANLRAGRPHGHIPYGYERRYDPATKVFVGQEPHPQRAQVVVEIARRYAAGESQNAIATDLMRRGVPAPGNARKGLPGGTWYAITVKDIALSAVYTGKRVYRGAQRHPDGTAFDELHPACWPALVDAVTHEQCVRRSQLPPTRRWARTSRPVHMLTGVMRCAVCGSITSVQNRPLPASRRTPGTDSEPYLVCKRASCAMIPEALADGVVLQVVAQWLARPKRAARLLTADTTAEIRAARQQEADARAELAAARALVKANRMSVASFADLEPDLIARAEAAEAALARLTLPGPVANLLRGTGDPRRRFLDLDMGVRRQVLAEVWEITLHPAGKGVRCRPEQVQMVPRTRPT